MELKVSHVFLTVHDQNEALKFYCDVLGFEQRADQPFEGYRWLSVASPSQPDLEIVLEQAGMGRAPQDADALRTLMAKGSLSGVILRADDVDAAFEKVRASGAEVMQEPIDQPYGVRDCAFRDPSGNQLRLGGPPRNAPQ